MVELKVSIEELLNSLPVLPADSENILEMPEFKFDMFKSRLANIKPYDGDVNTLNKFIARCEDLINRYSTFNDNDLNQHIFECIQEKLSGKAEIMVGRRVELDTWDKLKSALIQCFSDRRDIDCLVQELTRVRPYKNENLINFGNRLQLLVSSVIQRISNDISQTALQKNCQIDHYNKTALNTFIAGCTGNLRNNMHLKRPTSLEDAIAYVNEFDNFEKLYGNFYENNNKQKSNTHPNRNFNNTHFNTFNSPQIANHSQNMMPIQRFSQPQQNFRPNFSNQNTLAKPMWPSQPINIQPRQLPPQNYPTNRQVFGAPRNVFRPNQITPSQLTKPTPMSTTSRNPTTNTNRFNTNFNQNPQIRNQYPKPPNFEFQELFNNESDENAVNYDPENFYDNSCYYENSDFSYMQQPYFYENTETEEPSITISEIPQNTSDNENFPETSPEDPTG